MTNKTKALFSILLVTVSASIAYITVGKLYKRPEVINLITTHVNKYPQVGMYANIKPLVTNGYVNNNVVQTLSKWDWIIIDPPRAKLYVDALKMVKVANSNSTLLSYAMGGFGYVCGNYWFGGPPVPGCDTSTFAYIQYKVLRTKNSIIYNSWGSIWHGIMLINFRPDFTDSSMAIEMADSVVAYTKSSGVFGGQFSDGPTLGIKWEQNAHDSIDYIRSGFADIESYNAGYIKGSRIYYSRLKQQMGKGKLVVSNGGQYGAYDIVNGHMLEGFPDQPPANVNAYINLLLKADSSYQSPQVNFLCAIAHGDSSSAENQRIARFVLCVATLTDHTVGMVVGSAFDNQRGYKPWWLDEYAVDLGVSTLDAAYKGWLGKPLTKATVYLHDNHNQPVLWIKYYEHGLDIVNASDMTIYGSVPNGYHLIKGTLCPSVNNGLAVTDTLTIPAHDGRLLVKL